MRKDAAPSAVRILPAEENQPASAPQPPDAEPRRRSWVMPMVMAVGSLLVFVIATGPAADPDADAVAATTPPLLSAVTAETIDLTTPSVVAATTTGWEEVPFTWSGEIAGTLVYNGSRVAYGWGDEGAQAWLSGTGARWRPVPRFEVPEGSKSSVEHAVVWGRDIVALGAVDDGVGLWTARSLAAWAYQGSVPEMAGRQIAYLVAGPQLLAVADDITDGSAGSFGFTSTGGVTWTSLGRLDTLDDLQILTLAADTDWYFAGGETRCDERPCPPAIYRSRDGIEWEPTSGSLPGVLSSEDGAVLDITTTSSGLFAVGTAGGNEIAVWRSSDGSQWARIATDEPLFQPASVSVQVRGIDLRGDPFAEIQINGEQHHLAANSAVVTDAGTMRINRVGPTTVGLEWEDGWSVDTDAGPVWRTMLVGQPISVSAEGPRIVIAGHVGVRGNAVPAIWYSADSGQSWKRHIADPWHEGTLTSALVRGGHIIGTGVHANVAPLVWHSTWDTSTAEAAGIESVRAFVTALNNRDIDGIAAAVPTRREGTAEPIVELPSLGRANVHWWGASGLIDVDAVTDTVTYLEQLHTTIVIDDCTGRMQLGEVDSLRVSCGFTATSDLLTTMSAQVAVGKIDVDIARGSLQRVELAASPSQNLWQFLAAAAQGAPEDDRSTLVSLDDSGRIRFDPTFDAQSAAVHLRLAVEFTAGLLRPGESKVVNTALGTMEWQWLGELPLPVYRLDWVTPIKDRFIALGHGERGRWTEDFSLWSSTDGFEWQQMDSPPDVESMWSFLPYREGLLARAWNDVRSLLLVFDGEEWSEIAFPTPPAGGYFEVFDLAASGDTILALTGSVSEQGYGSEASDAWLIGADGVPQKTSLPPYLDTSGERLELVGSEEGFVLATSQYGTPTSMSVWHSTDGRNWSSVAETVAIEDVAHVWNLQHHFTEYFVVGDRGETSCSGTEDDGVICQNLVGLWSSPDGVAWDRVLTTSGEPVASYEIGSGSLGLVAVATDYDGNQLPRPIYLSPDGSSWERAGDLALLDPYVTWWWVSQPAVGERTIVIPGAAFDETAGVDSDVPFVIVGRFIDD